jgi:hypothetical protein
MKLELERGLKLFFSKKIGANYHLSSYCVFLGCSFTCNAQRTFSSPLENCVSNDTKITQFGY